MNDSPDRPAPAHGRQPHLDDDRRGGGSQGFLRATTRVVGRNLRWLVVGEATIKIGLLAAGAIVARRAGPAAMGAFSFGYFSAIVATNLFAQGMLDLMVRETARRPELATALLATATRIQLVGLALFGPLALAAALLVEPGVLRHAFVAFLPYALLRAATLTRTSVFRGLDRMEVEVQARAVELAVVLPLLALVPGLSGAVWMAGACFGLGGVAALATVRMRERSLPRSPEPDRLDAAPLVPEAAGFLGVSLVSQLMYRADTLALPSLGADEQTLGYYGTAAVVVWGVMAAPVALGSALYPTLVRVARRPAWQRGTLVALVVAGAITGTALAIALWATRGVLVTLAFGDAFRAAEPILGILVWALPGASIAAILRPWLAARHRQAWVLLIQALTVTVMLALDAVYVPLGGAAAAARAAVAAHSLNAVLLVGAALLRARPDPSLAPRAGRGRSAAR